MEVGESRVAKARQVQEEHYASGLGPGPKVAHTAPALHFF